MTRCNSARGVRLARNERACVWCLGALILLCHIPADGADYFWEFDGGDTFEPANWDPDWVTRVPGDRAFIANDRTAINTRDLPEFMQLWIGGVDVPPVQTQGAGTLNHTAGQIMLRGPQAWLVVGHRQGTTGTYNLSGNAIVDLNNDNMTVGENGTGVLNLTDQAIMRMPSVQVGRWGTGVGNVTQSGNAGLFATGELTVGREGAGTYTLDGGTIETGGDFSIGRGQDGPVGRPSVGVFNHNNGTVTSGLNGGWMFVGGHDSGTGTGTYNMNGGTLNSRFRIQIAQGVGSTGTFNHQSGDVIVGTRTTTGQPGPEGNVEIGQGGLGTYNLSGGNLTVVRNVVVGAWERGEGRLNITGGTLTTGEGLLVSRGSLNALQRADPVGGLVVQTGGTVNPQWVDVGTERFPGTTHVGTYRMSNGTLNVQFEMNVGRNLGEGVFDMSGGSLAVGLGPGQKTFNIGRSGGIGTFIMSGGTITVPEGFNLSALEFNRIGTGTGTQTGGTIDSNWVSIGQHGTAVYNLSGGTLRASGDFNVGDVVAAGFPGSNGTLNLSGTALAQGNTVYVGKNSGTTGLVEQTGGTFNVGGGGLIIAFQPGSTGTYNLRGGVLNGGISGTLRYGQGTGQFNMTGGTLKNFGIINLPLIIQGGRFILGEQGPGGVLQNVTTITGDYAQGRAAALELDIANPGQAETLDVTGAVALNGNLTITKDPAYEPLPGTTLEIIRGATLTGRFETITGNEAGPEFRFAPRYTPTAVELVVAIPGDANLDNRVTFVDFQQLERNFGRFGRSWDEGDFTGDGFVQFDDFRLLFENFGESFTPMPAAVSESDRRSLEAFYAANVPEPGLVGFGILGALYALARRRGC